MGYPDDRVDQRVEAAMSRVHYRVGDLITTGGGTYPTVYEVVRIEVDGLLRVRCLNWAPGYSVLISSEAVRPVSALLKEQPLPPR